jgi:hypothetical protein
MAWISLIGFDATARRLDVMADPDASPLMDDWERIIVEGNRRGVLSGLDGNDRPMPPLRYRGGPGWCPSVGCRRA